MKVSSETNRMIFFKDSEWVLYPFPQIGTTPVYVQFNTFGPRKGRSIVFYEDGNKRIFCLSGNKVQREELDWESLIRPYLDPYSRKAFCRAYDCF